LKIIVPVLVWFLLEIIIQGQAIDPILHLVQVPQEAVPHLLPLLQAVAAHPGEEDMEGVGTEILFSKNGSLKV